MRTEAEIRMRLDQLIEKSAERPSRGRHGVQPGQWARYLAKLQAQREALEWVLGMREGDKT